MVGLKSKTLNGRCLLILSHCLMMSVLVAQQGASAPANGQQFRLMQPNGSRVPVLIWGDEFFQHVESVDGYTLVRDPQTGWIDYAVLSDDQSTLVSTGVRYEGDSAADLIAAGLLEDLEKGIKLSPMAASIATEKNKTILGFRSEMDAGGAGTEIGSAIEADHDTQTFVAPVPDPGRYENPGPALLPLQGEILITGLTLVVEFPRESESDAEIPFPISFEKLERQLNQIGFTEDGYNGSVRDYFLDVSNGYVDYQNVVAPYNTDSKYYRAQYPQSHYEDMVNKTGRRVLMEEALRALASEGEFDFTTVVNASNKIPYVNLLYAGTPLLGWARGLWSSAHIGAASAETAIGTVRVSDAQITNSETQFRNSTFLHENGHLLFGWPDLYDIDDNTGFGGYGLMSAPWPTENPPRPNMYFRYTEGWEEVVFINDLVSGDVVQLTSNSHEIAAYTRTDITNRDLFLMEAIAFPAPGEPTNRSAGLPDEGLLIFHIDTFIFGSYAISIEQADGLFELEANTNEGGPGDLFHAGYRSRFSHDTNPNSFWKDGNPSNLGIEDISAVGAEMSFTVDFPGHFVSVSTTDPVDMPAAQLPFHCKVENGNSYIYPAIEEDPRWFALMQNGGYVYTDVHGQDSPYLVYMITNRYGHLSQPWQGPTDDDAVCYGKINPGTISPKGLAYVDNGAYKDFFFQPNEGANVAGVLVDGQPIGPRLHYRLDNVQEDHSIELRFGVGAVPVREVAVTIIGSGQSNVPKSFQLQYDESLIVDAIPDEDSELVRITVNGETYTDISSYTIDPGSDDLSIEIEFVDRGPLLGDANTDGNVNIVDALTVAQFYVGQDVPVIDTDAADVNCDGAVNIVDALLIAQYYIGLITDFPCVQ